MVRHKMIVDHLALAQRRVDEGVAIVRNASELVAYLERDSCDTRDAVALLVTFVDKLGEDIAERDRLRVEDQRPPSDHRR
jgi:hypothetical protein